MVAADNWWARTRTPIILRVPRGLVIVIGLAILCAVVLAYGVGHMRGKSAERLAVQQQIQDEDAMYAASSGATAAGVPGTTGTPGTPGTGTPGTPGSPGTSTQARSAASAHTVDHSPVIGEARVDGHNYFILATYPEAEAVRLVTFLRQSGLEANAVPGHNARLFQVVALRGFSREELNSPQRRDYESQLRRLGRVWKAQHKGATELSDMYLSRYSSPRTTTGTAR